jgi:hypothetical protein
MGAYLSTFARQSMEIKSAMDYQLAHARDGRVHDWIKAWSA